MTLLLTIGLLSVLLDQLTKLLVLNLIPLHSGKVIIPGFFNLVHVLNPGAAFSILAGANPAWRQYFFIGTAILVVSILTYAYFKVTPNDKWSRAAYSFVIGGAVGNLIDRVRLGAVVDFLDFYVGSYHWPAFNVADTCISIGAVMMFIAIVRSK